MAVHPDVGAKRIYAEYISKRNASRTAEAIYESVDDVLRANTERMEAEKARYLATYGIDITDLRLYDAVIDTTYKTTQQVVDILTEIVNMVK